MAGSASRLTRLGRPVIALAGCCALARAACGDVLYARRPLKAGHTVDVLAQVQPDEYYYGLGDPRNTYTPGGVDLSQCYIEPGGLPRPKVNEAYVWSLAKSGHSLYFGTVANASILVAGNYLGYVLPAESFLQAAEYHLGIYGQTNGLPAHYADWRPPRIFRYDLQTRTLARQDDSLPPEAQAHLCTLEGLRAGGAVPPSAANPRGLVVLAGPPLRQDLGGGVGFFFFDGTDGSFLGSLLKPEYINIRRFTVLNGDLYAGVQNTLGGYGTVIRIANNRRDPRFPFAIEEVGELDQAGADIAAFDGRIFVTTWPGYIEGGSTNSIGNLLDYVRRATGLWMSPPVPSTGLRPLHRKQWAKVWSAVQYEPDMLIAVTYGGGALCGFDGWLYFGTMHVPYMAAAAFLALHPMPDMPPPDSPDFLTWVATQKAVYANTQRVTSLFRGRQFFKPRTVLGIPTEIGGEVQLLSGYATMPVYNLDDGTWAHQANRMKQTPLLCGPGYDDSNFYTWSMAVFRHNLYIGTANPDITGNTNAVLLAAEFSRPDTAYGGDLLMIPSSRATRIEVVARNGLGNPLNYGFRTMVATDDELFIGTANANNLMADPADGLPDGGWELLRLTRRSPAPFDVDGDFVSDPAWVKPAGGGVALASEAAEAVQIAGIAESRPAWADYDNDGRTDPGWWVPAGGQWFADLSSRGGERVLVATTTGVPSGAVPVPADFDGDGQADPAWFDAGKARFGWRGSRSGALQSAVLGARAPVLAAAADYDGDGQADPTWYAPSRGEWVVQYSRRGGRRLLLRTRIVPKSVPAPADYDGDGLADLAVHNLLLGEIQVLRLSGGGMPFLTAEGLGPSWAPMPGDYDGDGRADFAWYQAASQTLHIRYANGGALTAQVPEVGGVAARPAAAPAPAWYALFLGL